MASQQTPRMSGLEGVAWPDAFQNASYQGHPISLIQKPQGSPGMGCSKSFLALSVGFQMVELLSHSVFTDGSLVIILPVFNLHFPCMFHFILHLTVPIALPTPSL